MEPAFVSFRVSASPLLPAPAPHVSAAAPSPRRSFLEQEPEKEAGLCADLPGPRSNAPHSHLQDADLLTPDSGETGGKGDMNPATEVDLFSSLGNGGRGSQEGAGSGGQRRGPGGVPSPLLPSWGRGLCLQKVSLPCADVCHSIGHSTGQHAVRCFRMGTTGLARVWVIHPAECRAPASPASGTRRRRRARTRFIECLLCARRWVCF